MTNLYFGQIVHSKTCIQPLEFDCSNITNAEKANFEDTKG